MIGWTATATAASWLTVICNIRLPYQDADDRGLGRLRDHGLGCL